MNKKMRELLALIDQKTAEARSYMDGENKDVSKASEILDEVDSLKKEYETEKRLMEGEKNEIAPKAQEQIKTRTKDEALAAFGKAAKAGAIGHGSGNHANILMIPGQLGQIFPGCLAQAPSALAPQKAVFQLEGRNAMIFFRLFLLCCLMLCNKNNQI